MFLHNMISEHYEVELPMIVRGDNNTALAFVTNEECSDRTKHWDVELKYMNELYKKGFITPERVDSGDNESDLHTKPLAREPFEKHRWAIGIR